MRRREPHEHDPQYERPGGGAYDRPYRHGNPLRKIGYIVGAIFCAIGLFYFVLMLTR